MLSIVCDDRVLQAVDGQNGFFLPCRCCGGQRECHWTRSRRGAWPPRPVESGPATPLMRKGNVDHLETLRSRSNCPPGPSSRIGLRRAAPPRYDAADSGTYGALGPVEGLWITAAGSMSAAPGAGKGQADVFRELGQKHLSMLRSQLRSQGQCLGSLGGCAPADTSASSVEPSEDL